MNTPFTIERTYNAPIKKVWEALTDKDKMKQWYFVLDKFEARVGFEFSFPGQGSKGETYIHHCKIVAVTEFKKLSYTWTYENIPGHSVVTFELFEEAENKTRVKLTHEGLGTFPSDNPDFAPTSFEGGWNELIGNLLKEFVEKV